MGFDILDPEHELFRKLADSPPKWWENLRSDPDIYINIRKDNSLNAYYRGASILKLSFNRKGYNAKIHYKFVPIKQPKNVYVDLIIDSTSVGIQKDTVEIETDFRNFDSGVLHNIKEQIKLYYVTDAEKVLQAELVKEDDNIIDTEFAYSEEDHIRIDIVRLDPEKRKIIFFELKLVDDERLESNSRDNYIEQLVRYNKFINSHSNNLKKYYNKLFIIRKKLNLFKNNNLEEIEDLQDYELLDRPILLVGRCTQKWLDEQGNIEKINHQIEKVARGCFYFGGAPKDLSLQINPRQKYRFVW
jgi:hypothetical protein